MKKPGFDPTPFRFATSLLESLLNSHRFDRHAPILAGRSSFVWCGEPKCSTVGQQFTMNEVTRILNSIEQGNPQGADELLPVVYEELRRLATQRMASEAAGNTLQPTALVHEAWLRLAGEEAQRWNGRGHFFAAAAEAMRRILIERARRRNALKRGGDFERVNLDDVNVAALADSDTLLLINDALEKLEKEDPSAAQVVKLRFFAGMTNDEAGEALGISARTAKRCWTFARAWLFQELRGRMGGKA